MYERKDEEMFGDLKALVEHGTMWHGGFIPAYKLPPSCGIVMVRPFI
jgi:hypothetical protein